MKLPETAMNRGQLHLDIKSGSDYLINNSLIPGISQSKTYILAALFLNCWEEEEPV
jgi:hypothetical protein